MFHVEHRRGVLWITLGAGACSQLLGLPWGVSAGRPFGGRASLRLRIIVIAGRRKWGKREMWPDARRKWNYLRGKGVGTKIV